MVHVPYKGGAPMLVDVLGGQVSLGYDNILTSIPHVRAGKVRALAVSGAKRSTMLPEVPTVAESALPGYDIVVWQGLLAPAGTPPEILARLEQATIAALQQPDVRERLAKMGTDIVGSTRQEFAAFIKVELEKAGKIIRQANIRAD
jgi:tripartite-type tricarboxylate transporter receptor subunit TctC